MGTGAEAYAEREVQALAKRLRRRISGEVRFDGGSRALYATDGSNYRQVPLGVVIPKRVEDVVATVALCREYGMPVLSRGGGTSLAGQCCNTAVILDFSKYLNRIIDIDTEGRTALVEPGVILDHLRERAERHDLTFGPDPATHDHNCLGGMIGNNSCGVHSIMAGRTVDNIEALEILTYDGLRMWVGKTSGEDYRRIQEEGGRKAEIYRRLKVLAEHYGDEIRRRYPDLPRRVSGYNVNRLLPEHGFDVAKALVGSEGTLVTVLQARVRLVHSPPRRSLAVIGFTDVYTAADHVPAILEHAPIGLEGMDDRLVDFMRDKCLHHQHLSLLPPGNGWLLVEFGGDTQAEADAKADRLIAEVERAQHYCGGRRLGEAGQQARLWQIREAGLAATARLTDGNTDTWPGWEDSAVHPDKIGRYLRDIRALLERYGYQCSFYGHFGDGCLHTRIDFDLQSRAGIERFHGFLEEAADLVVSYNGSFSGEHGDGQARAEFLPKLYGETLMSAFREFKRVWDPGGKMNPGKVIDAYTSTDNLRLGEHFRSPRLDTHFSYPGDGDFGHAVMRCVGVGVCRRTGPRGEVMCPSFQATREEKHTTRGRARMLFEMVHGESLKDGWKSKDVHDSLDLCLACKGCKTDCPVNVDMATYKAEFNAHYYRNKLRPPTAYSMGLIYYAARAASKAPRLANFLTHAPGISQAVKWLGGIAQQREITPFAEQSFRDWFRTRRPRAEGGGKRVILWPDTFNNYFRPEVAQAAVAVLEDAGCRVVLPERPLCCARPLYAWGMLDLAKRQLKEVLASLAPEIEAGTPVVGLEPACVSSLRDELGQLFVTDARAQQLGRQTYLLPEFLVEMGYRPPRLARPALVHVHCHQRAVIGTRADEQLLEHMGMVFEVLDTGCCGMAGSFGFEAEHYPVSIACAEQALLPRARAAAPDALLISNGFSCYEQARQGADCRFLHMAEVLKMALESRASS